MFQVAVAEDDPNYRQRLCRFIEKFSQENNVEINIQAFSDGLALTDHFRPEYDIIFLDIEMPNIDGLEAARRIRKVDQEVLLVFVTNMAQFALEGYKVQAYDYLVKPVLYAPFSQKMAKMLKILRRRPSKYIMLPVNGSLLKVTTADVYYIEMNSHRLFCHTVDGVKQMSSGTISSLEEQLAGEGFARCNSGILVNLRHVSSVSGNTVIVAKEELPISRPRKKEFLKTLNEFVGGY